MRTISLLVLLQILFLCRSIFAVNYYVDVNHPSANDTTNPGTEDLPFATIQKGIDVAYPGDTVFVKAGLYEPGSSGLDMVRSGSQDGAIVFVGLGLPLIRYSSIINPEKGWDWHGYKNYLEIHGFEITGSKYAVIVQGDNNKVTDCKVHDTGSDGVSIWGGSYNLYRKIEVWNTGWNGLYIESRPADSTNGEANYNIIEYCHTHDNHLHSGINIFPNNLQEQLPLIGNIIRFNIIENNSGGIYLRCFQDGEIYGNLIVENSGDPGQGGGGIFLHDDGGTVPFPGNLKIYNNTIVNNAPYFSINNASFSDVFIKNNILVQNYNNPLLRIEYPSGSEIDYNLYYNPSSYYIINRTDSLLTLTTARSFGFEQNGLHNNPLLGTDYKPTSGSAAIDAGMALGSPYDIDMEGNIRGQGNGWDLGAFESISSSIAKIDIRFLLEGAYDKGTMRTDLNSLGLIPLAQPYNEGPWNYHGTDSVAAVPPNVVDWILIETRKNITSKSNERAAFIKDDGALVDLDGVSPVSLYNISSGNYYVIVYHRNHLPIMSSTQIDISETPNPYDFTKGMAQAYGDDPMKDLGDGVFGMYTGDTNNSGIITAADKSRINSNYLDSGYFEADTNLNGTVNGEDKLPVISNNLKQSYVP